ncbi:hypothetical protein CLTEP_02220 [Clostridium tepidiprofundi DSM 19306]|uniref:Uncharacterized protein n=1 Tax=Clostridium tepidiprofundi DSM 19306 TaxID=1121338 RepID=A0A151B7G0_9CLOT|nr:hypothetical protein [Clostridium tepidiprofundi]KYH35829.1 hypothetical protein CLTEP_02220 [Clostridium tepidiprofundi DSM 19306]
MDIYFSTLDRKKVIQLPVIPQNVELLNYSFTNEEFPTLNSVINLKNYKKQLFTTTLESFFPKTSKRYRWLRSDVDMNIGTAFFLDVANKEIPIRYMVTDNNKELTNIPVTVENFVTKTKRNGDIAYTLTIKEYREVI